MAIAAYNEEVYFNCLQQLKNILENTKDKTIISNIIEGLKKISLSITTRGKIELGLKAVGMIGNTNFNDLYL